jgi:hypothetical protein
MATMATLRVKAASRFRDAGNDVISTEQWCNYINDAYDEVNQASPFWPWMETRNQSVSVTAGARTGNLPADVVTVNSVFNSTDDVAMHPNDGKGAQFRGGGSATETGPPRSYRLSGSTIEVYPLPLVTTTLILEVVVSPTRMIDGGAPAYPTAYHHDLVTGALALAYLDDGNQEMYNIHWANFQSKIEKMKNTILAARSEQYPVIRDSFWD